MAFLPAIPAALAAVFSTTAATATAATAADAAAMAGVADAGAGIGGAIATTAAASTIPGWVSTAATAGSLLSGAIGGYGALKQGAAQAQAAKYNATVAAQNATQAKANADIAGQAGAEQAGMSSLKSKAAVGSLIANTAAGNIDVNQGGAGSPISARESEQLLGEQDALTIRSNATRTAFGYETQATSDTAEQRLQTAEAAASETSGEIGGASTFLGGVSSGASKWAEFQLQSGSGLGTF